ncbi:MAG: hypothetical protein AAFS00_02355 [Bacteroidota bacterium]
MDPWIIGDGLETTPWRYWGDHVVALLGRPRHGGGPTDNYPIL